MAKTSRPAAVAATPPRRGRLRALVARGYQPAPRPRPEVEVLVAGRGGEGAATIDAARLAETLGAETCRRGVALLLPTYVGRGPYTLQLDAARHVHERLAEAAAALPEQPLVLFVAMQHGDSEHEEARRRLAGALVDLDRRGGPPAVGLLLAGAGKVLSLNAAFRLACRLGLPAIGWVDDDVWLEEGCLARLVEAFLAGGGRGAVGATKMPVSLPNLGSRVLFHLKAVADPAGSYPHGCCILVESAVVARGIPDRYASDDGFVCFELLRPGAADPVSLLRVVPAARCVHQVGGPSTALVRRINRMLLHHHVFLADYPADVSGFYFRHLLFDGLWPLGAAGRRSPPLRAGGRWLLKLLYLFWFLGVGAGLAWRGLLGRPLRSEDWGAYVRRERPSGKRDHAAV